MPDKKQTVGIIGGKGAMGSYFAAVFKKAGYNILISDLYTSLTNEQLAKKSEIVIVSVPIKSTAEVIKEIAPLLTKDQLIMDLTSLKRDPVNEMLKSKASVIGLHPMFNQTNPIHGQTVIMTPARPGKWFTIIKNIFQKQGAKVKILEADEHDKIMAIVQSLVHFADIAFGETLNSVKIPVKEYLEYASPSSELKMAFVARILAQDPELYGSIQLQNPHTLKILQRYAYSIQKLLEINQKKDLRKFKIYFKNAGKKIQKYKAQAFDETNYMIHSILEKRERSREVAVLKRKKHNLSRRTAGKKVAVLGPAGTFSNIAALRFMEKTHKSLPDKAGVQIQQKIAFLDSIDEVFDAVSKNNIKLGIVPLENLVEGSVRETLDNLYEKNVHVLQKITVPIRHALVALPGVKSHEIDTISSHAQALSQCSKFLDKKYSHVRRTAASSTMAAYQRLKGESDRHAAVIMALESAREMDCNILAEDIQDDPKNSTDFLVIEKGILKDLPSPKRNMPLPEQFCKIMIAFSFRTDVPGQLNIIFSDFAAARINVARIESRPSRQKTGNYIFFLDFVGVPWSDAVRNIFKTVKKKTIKLKLLGITD